MPPLYGTYLYADFATGRIWGVAPDAEGAWQASELLASSPPAAISAFGVDVAGEAYVLDWREGAVFRLVPEDAGAAGPPGWPPTLSETGCFEDLAARRYVPGVLAFGVNAPLWSDGAGKERAIVLPEGGLIELTEGGPWEFPDGTALIKTFLWGDAPLETRFLLRNGDAWRGATYRWNAEATEAFLLVGAVTEPIAGADDAPPWYYPSRADCLACHTSAAGFVLGVHTEQLNGPFDSLGEGAAENQLTFLDDRGYLAEPLPGPPATLPRFPAPDDEAASLGSRARAYLHANCAHCHQPGGVATATFDLRHTVPLAEGGFCDVLAQQGDLGIADARIVAPGAPERSTLWQRMVSTDATVRMPPLASSVPDELGVRVIEQWIAALAGCASGE